MCKSCTQFLVENFSAMRKPVPEFLRQPAYCMNCFDDQVAAPLADYNEKMEKAKDIIIYSKEQTKLTRLIKTKAEPYKVEDCEEEQDALMRMSYWAVEDGHNCLIHLQYQTRKIVVGSHKKTMFSATAIPCTIDPNSIRGHIDPP
jgi:uncharacterized protein YbjQ (UPF0145 family)